MHSVDLALFADELAARAATLAAQLERARGPCGTPRSSARRGGRSTTPRSPASNRPASSARPTPAKSGPRSMSSPDRSRSSRSCRPGSASPIRSGQRRGL